MTCFPRTLACLLLLLATALPLRAGWRGAVRTRGDSGIDILITSPVNQSPSDGCMPIWITIKNRSAAAHAWDITGSESSYVRGGGKPSITQSLRVGSGETARIPLLIPLELAESGSARYTRVSVEVEGYGVEDPAASIPSGSYNPGTDTAFLGLGDALATAQWGNLTQVYKDHGQALRGSQVEVALLPTDWRGLAGFDYLWLTEAEYTGLDADRRIAIRDWVNQGGRLLLCVQDLPEALRSGLGLPATGDEGSPGFGRVKLVKWNGKTPPEAEAIRTTLGSVDLPDAGPSYSEATDWSMTRVIGRVPLNAAFLIGFITVFAIMIGPVNLFVLADAKRRHRLFWTTPLIATVASLLLVAVIVLQDGFGGYGARSMVTLLLPGERKAIVVQEQVARTGLLFGGRFTTTEDLVLTQLKTSGSAARECQQTGRTYSGDWFSSHNVQAQRLEGIVPSRAEVQVSGAADAGANSPPTVVSSIPATLREISYIDSAGHGWHGSNLHTGERVTLKSGTTAPNHDNLDGSNGLELLQRVDRRPGSFRAVADDAPFLSTLASIRWTRQRAVYVGQVTPAR